jgi:hypothetical protein
VLTKDGIQTLADIVIIDPTGMDLVFWFFVIQEFVISNMVQAEERSFRIAHPINQFLPLAIEVYGCPHK